MRSLYKKIKYKLSERILDSAEYVSRFNLETINILQHIRRRQREESDNCYARTLPPDNLRIGSRYIVITEVFESENLTNLTKGLKKLFPKSDFIEQLIIDLRESAESLESALFSPIGLVSRGNTRNRIHYRELIQDSSLPKIIDDVEIFLHRAVSSLFIIEFVFKVSEPSTSTLLALQSKKYLPDIVFTKIPLGRNARCISKKAIETRMQRETLGYMLFERQQCVVWIKKNFPKGSFSQSNSNKEITNSFDVIKISGNPPISNVEEFRQWKNSAVHWGKSLGINMLDRADFNFNEFCFCWSSRGRENQFVPPKLLIFDNPLEDYSDLQRSFATPITLSIYLRYLQKDFENLRQKIFTTNIKIVDRLNKWNLLNSIQLERKMMVLERLSLDSQNQHWWLVHRMDGLNHFRSELDIRSNVQRGLDASFLTGIREKVDFLVRYIEPLRRSVNNLINIQNISSMHKLQRNLFGLTIVILILTIVTALPIILKLLPVLKLIINGSSLTQIFKELSNLIV